MEVAQPLNLLSLARNAPAGATVPGTGLEVVIVTEAQQMKLEQNLWLLVLSGDLVIDLPKRDFRILKTGDSLQLPAGTDISMQSLKDKEVVILRQRG